MPKDPPHTAATEIRKLAAIMFTDIVGFSRQMGSDETRMLRLLDVHNQLIRQAVAADHGTVIKTVGDAFLVDFPSVVHAVQCAQAIQAQLRAHNAEKAKDEQIHVRIGIHLGDIVQKDGDVFGDGVNIASRLQTLADPDTVCISDVVYRDVAKKLDLGTVVSLGRPKLKNIAERFQVYALLPQAPIGFRQKLQVQRLKLSRRVGTAHRLALAGLLLVALTLVAIRYLPILFPNPQPPTPTPQSLPLPDKPSIVVLPFTNMSEDSGQEYFSDGITEDITTDLSKISSLFVIARNSAFSYKGKSPKVQDVSREMGVRYVLEGSVRKSDGKIRITAQLVEGTTGEQTWSERYDRELKDIFALQDEIRQKIMLALKVKLTPEEHERFQRAPTNNLEAYDLYLRGADVWLRSTPEDNMQARQMMEKALTFDPSYAAAYTMAGRTYWMAWVYQWSQDPKSLERALAYAQTALALDESLPSAHMLLANVYQWTRQHDQAIAEAERAIALSPNNADAYADLGLVLSLAGRPAEAPEIIKKAMRFNPQYPAYYLLFLGHAYRLLRRYDEAVTTLNQALLRNPNLLTAHTQLTAIYSETGREEEAKASAAAVLRLNPHFSLEMFKQRMPYKDPAEVERYFNALRKAGLK